MLTVKQLLLKQSADAFDGRKDMSLIGSLEGITQEEASWRPDDSSPTAEQIVRHVAWAKSRFCHEGFGREMVLIDPSVDGSGDTASLPWEFPCGAGWGSSLAGGIEPAIELLRRSHQVMMHCLEGCAEEMLDQPIPTNHGKTAANFFSVMLLHDAYHAGQIRTRRTMSRASAARTS